MIDHGTIGPSARRSASDSDDGLDKARSNCGIVGVYAHPHAPALAYYALHSLQHRGQEAAGIASSARAANPGAQTKLHLHKGAGLVTEVFSDFEMFSSLLVGDVAIGHNRYSTTGSDNLENVQPLLVAFRDGQIAIAHNGNLTNTRPLRRLLEEQGTIFQTSTDTEVFLHLIARSAAPTPLERVIDALTTVQGSYSLVMLHNSTLIAARDPHGFRPLSLGRLGDAWIVASETCAFDLMRAEYVRDVEPGEVLVFDTLSGAACEPRSYRLPVAVDRYRHCIFEYIYFSRPDSMIFGEKVDKIRRRLGKALAEESPVGGEETVYVMSVPDSSNTAAIGFVRSSTKSGIDARFEIGLIRNHYIGRTFIQPGQEKRELKVRMKFNTVRGAIEGRTVVVIDDSIVRGTTSKMLINLIREANPKAIHVRISSPPIMNPCPYGMDFPSREELIAVRNGGDVASIRDEIGADTLAYLSLPKLLGVVDHSGCRGYCTACFSGEYPIPPEANLTKEEHDR